MTPQRPVGSCCRECRFENALDVAASAKCSLRAGGWLARGLVLLRGCDLGNGAHAVRLVPWWTRAAGELATSYRVFTDAEPEVHESDSALRHLLSDALGTSMSAATAGPFRVNASKLTPISPVL